MTPKAAMATTHAIPRLIRRGRELRRRRRLVARHDILIILPRLLFGIFLLLFGGYDPDALTFHYHYYNYVLPVLLEGGTISSCLLVLAPRPIIASPESWSDAFWSSSSFGGGGADAFTIRIFSSSSSSSSPRRHGRSSIRTARTTFLLLDANNNSKDLSLLLDADNRPIAPKIPSTTPSPPKAERDEDCYVFLGQESPLIAAGDNPASFAIYQVEEEEEEEWLDPPVKVPDPYGWMRLREDDDDSSEQERRVMDYIDQENRHTESFFLEEEGRRKRLQESLVQEYLSLHDTTTTTNQSSDDYHQKAEFSQLYFSNGFYYYTKRISHQPYPLHCRVEAADNSMKGISSAAAAAAASLLLNSPLEMNRSKEQIILDENEVANRLLGKADGDSMQQYFAIHSVVPIPMSSSGRDSTTTASTNGSSSLAGIAFSVDLVGDESYTIYVLDFYSSRLGDGDGDDNPKNDKPNLYRVATNTSGTIKYYVPPASSGVNDDEDDSALSCCYSSLHYIQLDPQLHRPFQWVEWKYDMNNDNDNNNGSYHVLHTEPDPRYWGDLSQTSDGQFLLWRSESSSTIGTMLALDLKKGLQRGDEPALMHVPLTNFVLDHRHGHWWILNLDDSADSSSHQQLYTSSSVHASTLTPVQWTMPPETELDKNTLMPCCLNHMATFRDHLVVQGRGQDGLQRIWVLTVEVDGGNHILSVHQMFDCSKEPAHYAAMERQQDFHSNLCLLTYESMVTPRQILQVNLTDKVSNILYEQVIPGYSKADYCCERLEVPSGDGTICIPVSLVYRQQNNREDCFPRPLHLLGYGAYGHSLEPSFSTIRLPLLDRGVVCAVAHVRGGGERGIQWHRSGKGVFKQNSINDFSNVARWLVENNWTTPQCLAAEGRSAGGLLVASAMNQNPDLFRTVVLGVPFLDILCTMADSTLPLTALEWDEWGNPHTQRGFDSIRGYAPMHNINSTAKSYPSCFMIGGRKDPRVPYWEPLKFAAALRHHLRPPLEKEERPILVKIDTRAGHSFGSNRTKYFEEVAWIYTFVLDQIS